MGGEGSLIQRLYSKKSSGKDKKNCFKKAAKYCSELSISVCGRWRNGETVLFRLN